MGKSKVKSKATVGTSYLKSLGLKPDEGWATAMAADLAEFDEQKRTQWLTLLRFAGQVQSCEGEEWSQVHRTWTEAVSSFGWGFADSEHERRGIQQAVIGGLKAFSPASDWLEQSRGHVETIGPGTFAEHLADWLASATTTRPGTLNQASANRETLRGLLLMWDGSGNSALYDRVRRLGEYALSKRIAAATMIAARFTDLASVDALGQLVLMAGKAKTHSARGMFDILINHVSEKTGVPPGDALEANVPTYGLQEVGIGTEAFGDYIASITVEGSEKVIFGWRAPTGKAQKSVPAVVRRDHKKALNELKNRCKDAASMLNSQRNRIERLYFEKRTWPYELWREYYWEHLLIGTLTRRLIWTFGGDEPVACLPNHDGFMRVDGSRLPDFDPQTPVQLWHPINSDPDEVLAWRDRLDDLKVTQPFKQAHREVYLLTEAERATGTFSNRFAGHILKQSQFRVLGKNRGWQIPLLGGWDNCAEPPMRRLAAFSYRVEFLVNEVGGDIAPNGGLLYVGTDQVRIRHDRNGDDSLIPLDQIDPLVLSEILRDVDLFVGVASVGNDPTWQDGGPEGRYRDYWHSYSFGDLGATAQTRKDILQRLIPRLKIADRCSFDEKFLVVKGSKRTYKIHMGSGNILMEPNDQYLCIVPNAAALNSAAGKVFLPFEGDRTMAIVLSKAFLLADDHKIKDTTILSQIG